MGRKRKRVSDDVASVTSVTSSVGSDPTATPSAEPVGGDGTPPRNAANERERARMRVLSRAFTRLKTSLPWVPADTKLSKLDTLRLASCYIAHLSRLLAEDDENKSADVNAPATAATNCADDVRSSTPAAATTSTSNIHPINLTWPFTISSRNGGGAAMPQSFQLPLSSLRGVASPGHVTSTAKVKVKVKVGADSSQQRPSSLSTTC